jgi:hypothetical protein
MSSDHSIIAWIAGKLKDNYSPESIEDAMAERDYSRTHVKNIIRDLTEKENIGADSLFQ